MDCDYVEQTAEIKFSIAHSTALHIVNGFSTAYGQHVTFLSAEIRRRVSGSIRARIGQGSTIRRRSDGSMGAIKFRAWVFVAFDAQ